MVMVMVEVKIYSCFVIDYSISYNMSYGVSRVESRKLRFLAMDYLSLECAPRQLYICNQFRVGIACGAYGVAG